MPVTPRLSTLIGAALFRAGAEALEEQGGRKPTLVVYAERRAQLSAIWRRAQQLLQPALSKHAMPAAAIEHVDDSWRTAWMSELSPVRLTARIWLAPTSSPAPALGARQHLLWYQPALAFGDGGHPTTRLAARAIETHYRKSPGGALLDIGTGSGVLALTALTSGAKSALGVDIAAEALRAASTNAALNGLSKSTRFVASAARVRGKFDLAVINIELRPLLGVLAKLPPAARRAPRLLVTGFLRSQLAPVRSALRAAGLSPGRLQTSGDWCLLEARR